MSVTHGEAHVDYGTEEPRYAALRHAIAAYYADLIRPLATLRAAVFGVLPLKDPGKAEERFRYTDAQKQVIDEAVEIFLTAMAGPDRTRSGFVSGGSESSSPDGILQQRDVFCYAIGLKRGADLLDQEQNMMPARQSPAVQQMLGHAFARLSDKGKLRLESVKDDIHSILTSAQDAGLNPLNTARQLAAQFGQYQGWEFQRLARTEAAFASERGVRDQMQSLGVQKVEWLISAGACDLCESFEGQVFDVDDDDNLPPGHPNCLCSVSPVTGNGDDDANNDQDQDSG